MDSVIIFIYLYVCVMMVLSIIDIKLSIAIYIASLILIPYWSINIMGFTISYSFLGIYYFVIYYCKYILIKKQKIEINVLTPFIKLHVLLLFLCFYAWSLPLSFQINSWLISFLKVIPLSIVIFNLGKQDHKLLDYIKYSFIVAIVISCIYGIFLMKLDGFNPYVSIVSEYFNLKNIAEIYELQDSRLNFSTAAKIQSTTVHPMLWCLLLCLSIFILLDAIKQAKRKLFYIVILLLVLFGILISGVRSGIFALLISLLYYTLMIRQYKIVMTILLLSIPTYLIIISSEDLTMLFNSFFNIKGGQNDLSGSSIQMRINQLYGAFDEIDGYELIGKGYGWTKFYSHNFGDHPTMLGFESVLLVIICNSGFIGMLIWCIFYFSIFKINSKISNNKEDKYFLNSYVICYITYTIVTGDYDYMPFFSYIYAYIVLNRLVQSKLEV